MLSDMLRGEVMMGIGTRITLQMVVLILKIQVGLVVLDIGIYQHHQ